MNEEQRLEQYFIRSSYGENRRLTSVPENAPVLSCSNGTFVGWMHEEVAEFRGIPFAVPPLDDHRWKAPMPAPDNDGIYEAICNGKSPIQTLCTTERASYYPTGEDCLYLNLWMDGANDCMTEPVSEADVQSGADTQAAEASDQASEQKDQIRHREKKAVMVFLHGGAYGWGGTADPLYDGTNFIQAHPEIVLITVGYRTGLMGFVDFSSVPGGKEFRDAPNLGILDQIEALRWIRKNCAAFGGDPDNITVFGESAGGGSVSLLPIIPEAKGLFRRVIAQSGSVALTFSKEQCQPFTKKLMELSGATCMDDLMALSERELMRINEKLNDMNNFPQRGSYLIPEDPYEPYRQGRTADIDILIGTNANETNYWIGELGGIVPFRMGIPVKFENDLKKIGMKDKRRIHMFMQQKQSHSIWRMSEFYTEMMFRLPAIRQAELHAVNGGKVFMYYWTKPSSIRFYQACHAVELAYVFGNTAETIYTGLPADAKISRKVQQMWVNFAKSGDPSVPGLSWPQFSREKRDTMVLSDECYVKEDPKSTVRKLLYPLLKYKIDPSYTDLDLNTPFFRRSVGIGTVAALGLVAAGISLAVWLIHKNQ